MASGTTPATIGATQAGVRTDTSPAPVISCGSGPDCDGQILIITDILGLNDGPGPKFARQFARLDEPIVQAVSRYAAQVRDGAYPDDDHCYHVKPGQMEKLRRMLTDLS